MNTRLSSSTAEQSHSSLKRLPTLTDCIALTKPKIGLMALIVSAGTLSLAPGSIGWVEASIILTGILMLVSGAGALNMYLERDIDGLMTRTEKRPLPSGRMSPAWALFIGLGLTLMGLHLLVTFGQPMTLFLGLFASFMYVLVYTPMKTKTWWSLPVGAIPGALPGLIGYSAVAGQLDLRAWVLFCPLGLANPAYHGHMGLSSQGIRERGLCDIVYPCIERTDGMGDHWNLLSLHTGTGLIWGAGMGALFMPWWPFLSGVWFMAIASSVNPDTNLNQWARKVFLATLVHQTVIFLVLALDVGLRSMLSA